MTTTAVIEQVEEKALSVPDQAKAFIISDNDQYAKGEEFLATCKALEDEIHEAWDKTVLKAHAAHKEAVASRKKYLDPLEEGRRILKDKMITYQDKQERIRKDEERKAQEEARKREEETQIAAALEAEQSGDKETAEAILAEPVQVAPVVVPKTAPHASRLSAGREVWSAEVTNLKELVKAIAADKAPLNLVVANMTALNGMARSIKNGMNIPGVKAVCKKV